MRPATAPHSGPFLGSQTDFTLTVAEQLSPPRRLQRVMEKHFIAAYMLTEKSTQNYVFPMIADTF